MVYAELIHNPYLLKSTVLFNGEKPRMHSRIAMYEKRLLKEWVDEIPQLFHDEMNGYDFDFLFTGTKPDFELIQATFRRKGITKDQVRLIHKREIPDPDQKVEQIETVLKWLEEHPHAGFEYENYRKDHQDLYDQAYPYMVIGPGLVSSFSKDIHMECTEDALELDETILENTPILFFADSQNLAKFRQNFLHIFQRKDVREEQLFFLFDQDVEMDHIIRVLQDLGLKNPQIVQDKEDKVIQGYIRNYLVTDYVRKAIASLQGVMKERSKSLDSQKSKIEESNAKVVLEIDRLTAELAAMTAFYQQLENWKNCPDLALKETDTQELVKSSQNLDGKIVKWNQNKTKIISEQEAARAANTFQEALQNYGKDFVSLSQWKYEEAAKTLSKRFVSQYRACLQDPAAKGIDLKVKGKRGLEIPDFTSNFLKSFTMVVSKPVDFFGIRVGNQETEEVKTWFFRDWRKIARSALLGPAKDNIKWYLSALEAYGDDLAASYRRKMERLIESKQEERFSFCQSLNEEQQILRQDMEWIEGLKEVVRKLEEN